MSPDIFRTVYLPLRFPVSSRELFWEELLKVNVGDLHGL